MDSMLAFENGEANRGKEQMVFDWNKAAELINEKQIKNASAGLNGDFEWTGGEILVDGERFFDSYTYLSSTWAKPLLVDNDSGEEFECFAMQHEVPNWGSETKWPDDASVLLEGTECQQ